MNDDGVAAFIKLRSLGASQAELQARVDAGEVLGDDDAEAFEFLNEEIARLLEVLQASGLALPKGCGLAPLLGVARVDFSRLLVLWRTPHCRSSLRVLEVPSPDRLPSTTFP